MLDAWLAWARRCQIPAFVELYHRIKKHRAGIIAAVTHGLSNGLTESVNTKLRLLTRIAYGFRSTDNLIALCLLDRGGHCPPLPGRPRRRMTHGSVRRASFVRVDNFCCRSWESMVGSRRWTRRRRSTTCSSRSAPRLRRMRTQRDVTLTELAAATGISKSTLSTPGVRSAQTEPRAAPADRAGAPDPARRARRRARHRRSADSAQAGEAQRRPDHRPPHTSTPRGARLEGGHPARTGQTAIAHARGL